MLEQVIAENTAVMRQLVELLKTGTTPVPPPAIEEPKVKKAAKPKAEEPKPEAPKIDYAPVKVAILRLSQIDRSTAEAVLASFGASKGPELKPEQYAEALDKLQAAIDAAEKAKQ